MSLSLEPIGYFLLLQACLQLVRARHRAWSGGLLRGGRAASHGEPRAGYEEVLSREGETGKQEKVQDTVKPGSLLYHATFYNVYMDS